MRCALYRTNERLHAVRNGEFFCKIILDRQCLLGMLIPLVGEAAHENAHGLFCSVYMEENTDGTICERNQQWFLSSLMMRQCH